MRGRHLMILYRLTFHEPRPHSLWVYVRVRRRVYFTNRDQALLFWQILPPSAPRGVMHYRVRWRWHRVHGFADIKTISVGTVSRWVQRMRRPL